MVVVGITDRLSGLLTQLEATQPDVLLLSWEIPFQTIADLLVNIRKLGRSLKIIFLSGRPGEEEKIIEAGADYFISKDAPPDKLLPILKQNSLPIT